MLKNKTLGFLMVILGIVIILWVLFLALFLSGLGLSSGTSFYQILPFFALSSFEILLSVLLIFLGLKYLKNKPLKQNKPLGSFLIFLGTAYFLFKVLSVFLANITASNPGGWFQFFLAFIWGSALLLIGLGMKGEPKDKQ